VLYLALSTHLLTLEARFPRSKRSLKKMQTSANAWFEAKIIWATAATRLLQPPLG
jgi:hypothetical protein